MEWAYIGEVKISKAQMEHWHKGIHVLEGTPRLEMTLVYAREEGGYGA